MKLIRNVLPESTIKLFNSEMDRMLDQRCWSLSSTTWGSTLHDGIDGVCAAATPSAMLLVKLRTIIKKYFPSSRNLNCNYHLWLSKSGINWHDDKMPNRTFGATLYLNDWQKDWGGLFLWEDKEKEIHCICPKAGTLVINTEYEEHSVTQVSSLAKYPRRSIQIWGED
jgi:hypothetical protein|tara:strand:+ start:63 stop:566 length:504 start_codon:yes stop_codon:yes gene_type:complete